MRTASSSSWRTGRRLLRAGGKPWTNPAVPYTILEAFVGPRPSNPFLSTWKQISPLIRPTCAWRLTDTAKLCKAAAVSASTLIWESASDAMPFTGRIGQTIPASMTDGRCSEREDGIWSIITASLSTQTTFREQAPCVRSHELSPTMMGPISSSKLSFGEGGRGARSWCGRLRDFLRFR